MKQDPRPELERIKEDSRQLRGTLREELASGDPNFIRESTQLLKFHGTYQQDNRDVRAERRKKGERPLYSLMVRSKIPGGRMTANQYLVHDALSKQYAGDALRVTTRQGFQFHGVLKANVRAVIKGVNDALVTTKGACGDVVRNVLACPAPSEDRVKLQVYEHAKAISDQFLPQSGAYHEIWINGEKVSGGDANTAREDKEPIYGKAYLPRKFKIAIAFPEDNCIDVYTHDIGLVPVVDGPGDANVGATHASPLLRGFNVLVGGGLGMSHGAKDTFPRLADPLCFAAPEDILALTRAIVLVQRDHGDRKSRKHARMKYLIHDRGLKWFQAEVEKRYGEKLNPPHPVTWKGFEPHLGWQAEGNGKYYFGVSIENGRIRDEGRIKMKSGLRAIVSKFKTPVHLTATQDLLICGLRQEAQKEFESILEAYGIPLPGKLSNVEKHAMACPALPTCGLAITESERALPSIIDELEGALRQLGLGEEAFTTRMTGCPNGCARPYSSEIGFVGRKVGTYNIYLGGSFDGTRLNRVFKEDVPKADVVGQLVPVLEQFKKERRSRERFGDFCDRVGIEQLKGVQT